MLTITEASKITGRHPDTIRRLIKRLAKDDSEAKNNIKQELINGGFSYHIAKDYLLKHIQVPSAISEIPMHQPMYADMNTEIADEQQIPQENLHSPKQPHQGTHTDTQGYQVQNPDADIRAYRETIDILKEQLKQKDKQIDQLLERDRETNILLKGYQDKYLLDASSGELKPAKPMQANNDISHETSPEKQPAKSTSSSKPHKFKPKKAEKQKKKGLLSWFS
ncbi:MAG: hypothetical protein JO266_09910 [Acidobacteria bacterium]|nr:hypothetical protein [Acidobacteriota bacterium]